MELFKVLMVINVYIIVYLIYTESLQPLINRIDGRTRDRNFMVYCFTLFLLFLFIGFFAAITVSATVKNFVSYSGVIVATISCVVLIYKSVSIYNNPDNYGRVFIHSLFIAIFISIGTLVSKLDPNPLFYSILPEKN